MFSFSKIKGDMSPWRTLKNVSNRHIFADFKVGHPAGLINRINKGVGDINNVVWLSVKSPSIFDMFTMFCVFNISIFVTSPLYSTLINMNSEHSVDKLYTEVL